MTSKRDWNRAERPFNPLNNEQNSVAFTGVNGVPLGGIGAGCVEMLPDGRLGNFTTNNNFQRNQRIESMPGTFFAVATSDGDTRQFKLLQTTSSLPLGPTGASRLLAESDILQTTATYPSASATYQMSHAYIELNATGTVVPGDLKIASMPAALFTIVVENQSPRDIVATAVFSWENIAGCLHGVYPDGRAGIAKLRRHGHDAGLVFTSPPNSRPNQTGQHAILVDGPDGSSISFARYNTWDSSPVLGFIEDDGEFRSDAWDRQFYADSEYTGAIACKASIPVGESAQFTFALSWYYPDFQIGHSELADKEVGVCDMGHQYAQHWANAEAVAQSALDQADEIACRVEEWHQQLQEGATPEWLALMLANNLYVLTVGTLWDREGRFSLMETPYGPMMGTLDQRFYSSIATALFFPELEKSEMRLFAITKHPEDRGRVYHDLGNLRFDDPKTGTTAKKWTDLNPKFVLMALRNYLWHNDRDEIESLWPYIKEMMAYTLSQDTDSDGLPNNDDRSTTYDDWAFFGANSYASSLWLAALHAFRKLSELLDKPADWAPYADVLPHATQQFEARLWDEALGYYRLYNDDRNAIFSDGSDVGHGIVAVSLADAAVNQGAVPTTAMDDHPKINRDCHDGQLAGQWYADLLGLGNIVRPERIQSAIREIYKRNATPRGIRKGVTPDGDESPNPESSAWWSEAGQCWPGYEMGHYAALAIGRGEVADGLTTVKRLYDQIHVQNRLAFNQPLRWNVESGMTYGWGSDRYMNSPSVWFVQIALLGLVINRPEETITLRPRYFAGDGALELPIFLPGNIGTLRMQDDEDVRSIQIEFVKPEPFRRIYVERYDFQSASFAGGPPYKVRVAPHDSRLFEFVFEEPLVIENETEHIISLFDPEDKS